MTNNKFSSLILETRLKSFYRPDPILDIISEKIKDFVSSNLNIDDTPIEAIESYVGYSLKYNTINLSIGFGHRQKEFYLSINYQRNHFFDVIPTKNTDIQENELQDIEEFISQRLSEWLNSIDNSTEIINKLEQNAEEFVDNVKLFLKSLKQKVRIKKEKPYIFFGNIRVTYRVSVPSRQLFTLDCEYNTQQKKEEYDIFLLIPPEHTLSYKSFSELMDSGLKTLNSIILRAARG